MAVIGGVGSPPLELCGSFDAKISDWLCEDRLWPVMHTTYPFILYLYIRDFKFCFLLVYLFETLEGFFEVFGSTDLIEIGSEKTGDHLIGDPSMGFMGILIAMIWVRIFKYHYMNMTPFYWSSEWSWVYYALQFISLALPTGLLYSFPNSINGIVPIFYIFIIVWIPGFYWFFSVLDQYNRHWTTRMRHSDDDNYTISYSPLERPSTSHYRWFHGMTSLLLVLYLSAFVYRWTSVYVMACIYNGTIIIITSIYGLATGRLDLLHKR